LDRAENEVRRIHEESMADLSQFYKSQEQQLRDRLMAIENAALHELNEKIIALSVATVESALKANLTPAMESVLIAQKTDSLSSVSLGHAS
jgi:hypothetical protein